MTGDTSGKSGVIIGKFLPPHRGHQYLVDFARQYVDHLTVLVCTLGAEPIPGELRYQWMKEMFPTVEVMHVTDENPQEPHEHPDFWSIWRNTIQSRVPQADYLFASEEYGWQLAETIGATYVPVNHGRTLVPISGTMIRQSPTTCWAFLPEVVRPYFLKRVCIFGPESTGKSTLARQLSETFHTCSVHEYAREYLDLKDQICTIDDIPFIARGQMAAEDALARQANRVLICDTDLLTTMMWAEFLFGECPQWIVDEAERRHYDLYLLMDMDVPWVEDAQRYQPEEGQRRAFLDRCRRELELRNRPYVVVSGSWDDRWETAERAVARLLRPAPAIPPKDE